jgi:hypothetical protein
MTDRAIALVPCLDFGHPFALKALDKNLPMRRIVDQ